MGSSRTLTPMAVAILGLLREAPMHPYEMQQLLLERHRDAFFKVRPGSLYHTVGKLADNGLIEEVGTDRQGNRPERTTYRITEAGDLAVTDWVREQLATPADEHPSYPYVLTEAHNLRPEEAVAALTRRCEALDAKLSNLSAAMEARSDAARVYRIGGEQLIDTVRAELQWTTNLINLIENKEFPWHPTK